MEWIALVVALVAVVLVWKCHSRISAVEQEFQGRTAKVPPQGAELPTGVAKVREAVMKLDSRLLEIEHDLEEIWQKSRRQD